MKFNVIGHRGNPSQKPENTISSFESAKKCGVYGVETDIQITKDHRIVIFHDDAMERLTGRNGMISDFTLSELEEMGILGTDEKIPTLDEFLAATHGVKKFIELKTRNNKAERINFGLEKALNEYFKGNYSDDIYFISFDIDAIRTMKEYDSRYRVGIDIGKETSFIWDSMIRDHVPDFLDFVIPEYSIIEKEERNFQKIGEKIIPWVINDEKELKILEEKNIQYFMTDSPCKIRELIE
ncbi:glycerophosphodiester phosphodiesterase [Cuniculiplasma sp. SKW4]|uniref:glycerophosphodiester phosphodiesterase n=1 Tax=Cuniculiplasma sp. SKW4 TaxID=3400171 RepID=UPI003FD62411